MVDLNVLTRVREENPLLPLDLLSVLFSPFGSITLEVLAESF